MVSVTLNQHALRRPLTVNALVNCPHFAKVKKVRTKHLRSARWQISTACVFFLVEGKVLAAQIKYLALKLIDN